MRNKMRKYIPLISFYPISVAAEVSDKIPNQTSIWVLSFVSAVFLVAIIRVSKWSNILAVPVLAYLLFLAYETSFGEIASSIRIEQGVWYSVTAYFSVILCILAVVLGNYLRQKSSH